VHRPLGRQRVDTVESLAPGEDLNPLQQAFREEHALQCGFCTPAFLMTATALAAAGRPLSDDELRQELSGVMCRCTGYEFIFRAVRRHIDEAARTGGADARAAGRGGAER
jgi:carbon-monoxide dehydrogenase small subunit